MIVTNMPQGASLSGKNVLKLLESTKKFSSLVEKKGTKNCESESSFMCFTWTTWLFDTCEQCELRGGKLEVVI